MAAAGAVRHDSAMPLLDLTIEPQPDDRSCGVTCLGAVYRYYGLTVPVEQLGEEVEHLETGGTLAVMLGADALRRGFRARIYSYNLQLFDPTWFGEGVHMADKLRQQQKFKTDPKLRVATKRYIEFLDLGGRVRFREHTARLIRTYLKHGKPILVGLSATYLYQTAREYGPLDDFDDVRGEPQGHFVVLCGYDKAEKHVRVADPLLPNPMTGDSHYYNVSMDRLIAAIMLGIVTYDANLLVIEPKPQPVAAP